MHYSLQPNKGFTLIELMIVITIIGILTIWTFVPYNTYSNIAKVKSSKELFDQSIQEARNITNWVTTTDGKNINLWLVIEKDSNELNYYSFPHDYTWSVFDYEDRATKYRSKNLEKNIFFSKIIDTNNTEQDKVILYFKAPNWEMDTYINPTQTWSIKNIIIWLNKATNGILSKEIKLK